MRYVERMSKASRGLTPVALAELLVREVRRLTGARRVAVLYCDLAGPYPRIADAVCWPVLAEHYSGPWPVVCHPPCGPWGKFKWRCIHQRRELGPLAIEQCHRFGGVVEHPVGSTLFRDFGRVGARTTRVRQCAFGHAAEKDTWLYWSV